jgi:hypothetical protein
MNGTASQGFILDPKKRQKSQHSETQCRKTPNDRTLAKRGFNRLNVAQFKYMEETPCHPCRFRDILSRHRAHEFEHPKLAPLPKSPSFEFQAPA